MTALGFAARNIELRRKEDFCRIVELLHLAQERIPRFQASFCARKATKRRKEKRICLFPGYLFTFAARGRLAGVRKLGASRSSTPGKHSKQSRDYSRFAPLEGSETDEKAWEGFRNFILKINRSILTRAASVPWRKCCGRLGDESLRAPVGAVGSFLDWERTVAFSARLGPKAAFTPREEFLILRYL